MKTPQTLIGTTAAVTLVLGGLAATTAALPTSSEALPVDVSVQDVAHDGIAQTQIASSVVRVAHVDGAFAFDQNKLTGLDDLTSVFRKASATLCNSLPDYVVATGETGTLTISKATESFEVTLDDMKDKAGTSGQVLTCACATNLAGGGAIATAEVSGVSVEAIANMANA